MYLVQALTERTRKATLVARLKAMAEPEARQLIADELPARLGENAGPQLLEELRLRLVAMPGSSLYPGLGRDDWAGAFAVFLMVVISTFPVVIPFLVLGDARLALRISYAVAILMLFCCGYVFGIHSGLRPWAAGLSMVAFGSALVGVAIALGG